MCKHKKKLSVLGAYKFVTVDNEGKIGSVYFECGRIRLVHRGGPCVSIIPNGLTNHQYIASMSKLKDCINLHKYNSSHGGEVICYLSAPISRVERNLQIAKKSNNDQFLFEIRTNSRDEIVSRHPSRGYPWDLSEHETLKELLLAVLEDNFDNIPKESIDKTYCDRIKGCNNVLYELFKTKGLAQFIHNPNEYKKH